MHPRSRLEQALSAVLDVLPTGIVITTGAARIVVANRAARATFAARQDILLTGTGVLTAPDSPGGALLKQSIGAAAAGERRLCFRLTPEDPKSLMLAVMPTRRQDGSKTVTLPYATIFLFDPLSDPIPDATVLTALFSFTPAEGTVAQLMLRGLDLDQTAAELGISAHTVRNHLRRLFAKTNTRRQADLLFTLLVSPARLRFAD